MLHLAGKFHPAKVPVLVTDATLKDEAGMIPLRAAKCIFKSLSIVGVNDFSRKLGYGDGILVLGTAVNLIHAVVLPEAAVLIRIPLPDSEFRRFGGEPQSLIRLRHRPARLNLS